ncbi:MAG: cobaltochelatase subunit CobN, partial [Proteobacteria bacterium]|nr:cobaltochelatase subunit CobN [Pseudomonadota bacterium]
AASAQCVEDHHFDAVFDAFLDDPLVRDWMAEVNPAALADIAARLAEAQARGLWKPRRNSTGERLAALSGATQKKEKVA